MKRNYQMNSFEGCNDEKTQRNLPAKSFLNYKDMWKMEVQKGLKSGVQILHVKDRKETK